jgi:hypothetical protein
MAVETPRTVDEIVAEIHTKTILFANPQGKADTPTWEHMLALWLEAKASGADETIIKKSFEGIYFVSCSHIPLEKLIAIFERFGKYYKSAFSTGIAFRNMGRFIHELQRYEKYYIEHNIHKETADDTPIVICYDFDSLDIISESYSIDCDEKNRSIPIPISSDYNDYLFSRYFTEGPAHFSKIPSVDNKFGYVEFYAHGNIIQRQPHLPSITLKLLDGSGDIKVHTGSFGEVLYIYASGNVPYTFVEMQESYQMNGDRFYDFINCSRMAPGIAGIYGIVGIFKKIIWADGVIYERLTDDSYVAIYPNGKREYYKDTYTYLNMFGPLWYNNGTGFQLNYSRIKIVKVKFDYLLDVPRDMGVLHRVAFRRDEHDGSEYLLPAIEHVDDPDSSEFWVNGKKVSWNWAPKVVRKARRA